MQKSNNLKDLVKMRELLNKKNADMFTPTPKAGNPTVQIQELSPAENSLLDKMKGKFNLKPQKKTMASMLGAAFT